MRPSERQDPAVTPRFMTQLSHSQVHITQFKLFGLGVNFYVAKVNKYTISEKSQFKSFGFGVNIYVAVVNKYTVSEKSLPMTLKWPK